MESSDGTHPAVPTLWVILPTFNEAPNVAAMLRAIGEVLAPWGEDVVLLVVDDNSPDGTAEIAEAAGEGDPRIRVLRRPERSGIGPAYLAGFRAALQGGARRIVEMDCDFSHPPAALPALIATAEEGDLAIGSRYVPGGSVERWGLTRRAVSRIGCAYARTVLGVSVRDLTSGFKCFRREVLEALPLSEVSSRGYAFQIEVTYRALCEGFSVVELPITFVERSAGRSKMGPAIVWEAIRLVPALRRRVGSRPEPTPEA